MKLFIVLLAAAFATASPLMEGSPIVERAACPTHCSKKSDCDPCGEPNLKCATVPGSSDKKLYCVPS
ncbi:unnamed protein product [Penicillium bialowiezense]